MNYRFKYKKPGFTLIEVVAALAIISIFAVFLVPKVSKYVEEAQKTKALEDVRMVVLAVEDYNISTGNIIGDTSKFQDIKAKVSSEFVDLASIETIENSMSYKEMQQLINGQKNFKLENGMIKITS